MYKNFLPLLTALAVCSLHSYAQSATAATETPINPWQENVGVEGTHLTLDGHPWNSRGVAIQGFVRPLSLLHCELAADPTNKVALRILNSRQHFGQEELEHIRAFHANTIRFVVSQPALDPNSGLDANACPLYDANYLPDLVDAIRTARRAGFVVMIMMQDEDETGDLRQAPLPTDETQRDWDRLLPPFGEDRGVVFELYNEPDLTASPENWKLWRNGGEINGTYYFGMQTLLDELRAKGARNVVVADALATEVKVAGSNKLQREAAETLENVLPLNDPLNRVVYAVHPYQHGIQDESHWEKDFGIPSKSIPVWADEWSAPTKVPLALGTLPSYQEAVDVLNFLRAHSIPVCTGGFDVPHWVVQDVPGWTLTNYKDYSDKSNIQGSGTLVYHDFVDDYSRPLTAADGL